MSRRRKRDKRLESGGRDDEKEGEKRGHWGRSDGSTKRAHRATGGESFALLTLASGTHGRAERTMHACCKKCVHEHEELPLRTHIIDCRLDVEKDQRDFT
ncbi:hypothetical protein ALC57_14103 [Trachymyrmex cornetzi]|uniref:Uncharacterized protein n=1 Tax=Trachymyrmex cornetzi TaxID=471704 RepID=A0A151IZ62_9HYME|nr:hypothetical protein ALC57_14103 [Trachymyrmex cornetzi]